MSQSVTITRSSGASVTVNIDADDGNASNVSDEEARQAFERALAQSGVTRDSLVGGTMTVGSTSLSADRYTALMPAASAGGNAAVTPAPDASVNPTLGYGRHRLTPYAVGGAYGGNGGAEPFVGAGVNYAYRLRLNNEGTTVIDVGAGVEYNRLWGRPNPLSLGFADRETGVISRDVTDQHSVYPYLMGSVTHYLSRKFSIGGLLMLGPSVNLGTDTSHRLDGPGYGGAYCPPDGGIFGDDITGCENRPLGPHTTGSNDSSQGSTNVAFRLRAGLPLNYHVADRAVLNLTPFFDLNAGSITRAGGGAMLGLTIPSGDVEPANPRSREAAVDSNVTDATGTVRPANQAMSLTDDQVRDLAGLPAGASIQGVQFDNHDEDTTAPYEIRAEWMTPGDHELKVRYRMPGDSNDRIRRVSIRVGTPEPVRIPEGGTGEAYGLVLSMPATAMRPAPDVVGGVSTPRPIPVGDLQTTAAFPEGATYQIYVDGNPVGTAASLPRDRSTPLTVPATVGDGPHQMEVRVSRPGQAEIRYPARAVRVGPGVATLSAGSITTNPPSGGYYAAHLIGIRITSDVATRARITIGTHTQDVDLIVGVNNFNLAGEPKTWNTGGAAGRNQINQVRIQPLDAAGALTGTAVDIGSVTTRKAGGGGRGRGRAPSGAPPLR